MSFNVHYLANDLEGLVFSLNEIKLAGFAPELTFSFMSSQHIKPFLLLMEGIVRPWFYAQ